MQLLYTLAQ